MCGIFAIIPKLKNYPLHEERLQETARLMHHRGPDHTGIYKDDHIAMVHTRLSLLDLKPRSNQPFWDRQRRFGLMYNGEIYNFMELRKSLEATGVDFRTTSDTEVLLECILHHGLERTLTMIEGMFAFGIYDRKEKTITIARDRFGIKPLFFSDGTDSFIFASEIMAMRPWIELTPDLFSISSFLMGFAGPTKSHTFFKGIQILPPGGIVKVKAGADPEYSHFFALDQLWDLDYVHRLKSYKPEQVVDMVEERLWESVQKQLIADAPVGALCSGGLDSSLIMAMAARSHNHLAIFHADVKGPLSEYSAARLLTEHLKLDMKTVTVHDTDFIDLIPEVIQHYGHPFYITPHSVPFLMVSKLVRENGVKAVLSGEGADECFLGYNFLVPSFKRWRRNALRAIGKLANPVLKRLGLKQRDISPPARFVMGFSPFSSIASVSFCPRRPALPDLIMGLHNRFEVALETKDIGDRIQKSRNGHHHENYLKSFDLLNYNLRMLLHRNDSMGMTASIESRFPFLDSDLVKMAVSLPYPYRIRFSPSFSGGQISHYTDKWILRKVAERYLPKELSQRRKRPFSVDAYERMTISPALFEKSFIAELFGLSTRETRYLFENATQDLKLKMMHLETWLHVCLNNLPNEQMADKLHRHITIKTLKKPSIPYQTVN